jgi:hypothetical protein
MMKKFIFLVTITLVATFTLPIFAEDTDTTTSTGDAMQKVSDENPAGVTEKKPGVMRGNQNVQNAMEQKRLEFTERVQNITDERKLQVLQRVDDLFNTINERRTTHFQNVLDRLRHILDRIQSRSDVAKGNGKDVSAVETAIGQATTAIDKAEQMVADQKAKTYDITVTDETTARSVVSDMLEQLRNDLHAVYDVVKDARQAVFDAFRQLAAVVGTPLATPTATSASDAATQ